MLYNAYFLTLSVSATKKKLFYSINTNFDVRCRTFGQNDRQFVEIETERCQFFVEQLSVGHVTADQTEVSVVKFVAALIFKLFVFFEKRSKNTTFRDFSTFRVSHDRKVDLKVAALIPGNDAAIF
jgi:hypothetical protein